MDQAQAQIAPQRVKRIKRPWSVALLTQLRRGPTPQLLESGIFLLRKGKKEIKKMEVLATSQETLFSPVVLVQ
jgi:hypothetical protein